MKVSAFRKELHARIRDTEPIELDDLKLVNPFERLDVMKTKTRDLLKQGSFFSNPKDEEWFIRELAEFGNLAVDWVNGGEIDWEDSLPDRKAKQILAIAHAKQKVNVSAGSDS